MFLFRRYGTAWCGCLGSAKHGLGILSKPRSRRSAIIRHVARLVCSVGRLASTTMDDYRRDFYKRYRTTHVETRKPGGTPEDHARRFSKWDRLIGTHLPRDRDGVVLDCGCGEGYLVSWLQARGYRRAVGVDASPEEVAVAHRLGLPVECAEIAPSLAARSG